MPVKILYLKPGLRVEKSENATLAFSCGQWIRILCVSMAQSPSPSTSSLQPLNPAPSHNNNNYNNGGLHACVCAAEDIEPIKALTRHPDSNQQPTACIRSLRCLSSDPFARKIALNIPLNCAANSTIVCTLCTCVRFNKPPWQWVALLSCQYSKTWKWRNGVHRKTKRTQYCTPPTHPADLLAHHQLEKSYS